MFLCLKKVFIEFLLCVSVILSGLGVFINLTLTTTRILQGN